MDDDDDVGIPFLVNKPKLKSIGFVSSVSSLIFNDLKEAPKQFTFNLNDLYEEKIEKGHSNVSNVSSEKPGLKRARESEEASNEKKDEKLSSKKMKIELTPEKTISYSKPKKPLNDCNYRRLNMKTFKCKGKPGQGFNKGAKYKRFLWKKNKYKNNTAKYNNNFGDKDDETVNYNLIATDSHENQENEVVENVDPMSSEAIFAKISKRPEEKKVSKQKLRTKEAKNKREMKKDEESPKEKEEEESKKVEKKKRKVGSNAKSEKSKKALKKSNLNESDSDFVLGQLSSDENDQNEKDEEKQEKKKRKNQKEKKTKKKPTKKVEEAEEEVDEDEQFYDQINEIECAATDQLLEPQPLLSLKPDGSLPELPAYVYKVLKDDFGHKSFRPNQADAVLRIMCGVSTLVVLSTGYGKSLIYQLAARLFAKRYPGSTVLVVSPLISLMQDQLHNLSKCLNAAVCDSQLGEKEFEFLVNDLNEGRINILFMSPEAIMNKKIRSIPRLAFVCIDEVHCLSQWSHNFRPSYLQLCQILTDHYNVKCILGLTATATRETIEEIGTYFYVDKSNIISGCKLPNNLEISVSKDSNKEKALVELLRSHKFRPYFNHVIIYCSRREQTDRLAQLLRLTFQPSFFKEMQESEPKSRKKAKSEEIGVAESYHAGLMPSQRKRIQNQFIKGKLRIIVATTAFGMGINMSDIRAVIHYNMPKTIENYVQEIGRAGRDAKLSRVHLFLETEKEEINEIKKYIHMNGYDQKTIKKVVLKTFRMCDKQTCGQSRHGSEYVHHAALNISEMVSFLDMKEESILTLICYLQSTKHLKLMTNCYSRCTLRSYKGFDYLKQKAAQNELLGQILKQKAREEPNSDSFSFDLIELCEALKCEYGALRDRLRKLEWEVDATGNYKSKTGISFQFSDLAFYVRTKCVSDDDQLDEIFDVLWQRVTNQMDSALVNFSALYRMLSENSFDSIHAYIQSFADDDGEQTLPNEKVVQKSDTLKEHLNSYFENTLDLKAFTAESAVQNLVDLRDTPDELNRLATSIRRFIGTYDKEAKLNGLVIARIFHGIGTPNYPAEFWGRNRNFWRAHLNISYETIIKVATEQLFNF